MKKVTTIILVAGKSTRFKHKDSKIFQDLAGLSIIDHVYKIAKRISYKDVIFVCNNILLRVVYCNFFRFRNIID